MFILMKLVLLLVVTVLLKVKIVQVQLASSLVPAVLILVAAQLFQLTRVVILAEYTEGLVRIVAMAVVPLVHVVCLMGFVLG
jgi:hypothetical protein